MIHMAPPVRGGGRAVVLDVLPLTFEGWAGSEGIPEGLLPVDPNETAAVRRTYRSDQRMAWVSVALFSRQDDPGRRASIGLVYPEKDANLIERVSFALNLNGPLAETVSVPAVVIHKDSQRLIVAYWHQIGPDVYGSEYWFRLALLRSILLARRADVLLVRIAIRVDPGDGLANSLAAVARLARPLYIALSQDAGNRAVNRQSQESGR